MRIIRFILWAGLALCLLPLLAGYVGSVHVAGDSFAVFRVYLSAFAACLSVSLILLKQRLAWLALCVALIILTPRLWALIPNERSAYIDFTIYQKNMRFKETDRSALLQDILQKDPDFITLQEVGRANRPFLDQLKNSYPYQHYCDFLTVGGTAVLSRWPIIEESKECALRDGLTLARFAHDNCEIGIASAHLHWPWPYSQSAHLDRILPILERFEGPLAIGGDFNMVPWAHSIRCVMDKTQTTHAGHEVPSITLFGFVQPPIDHVFARDLKASHSERRPLLGSDHFGILASLDLETC